MLSTIFRRLLIKAASTRICFEENGKIFQVHTFRFQIRYFYTDWPSDSEITNLKILLEREIKMWYCYPTRDQILWRRSFFIRHTTNGKWRFKKFPLFRAFSKCFDFGSSDPLPLDTVERKTNPERKSLQTKMFYHLGKPTLLPFQMINLNEVFGCGSLSGPKYWCRGTFPIAVRTMVLQNNSQVLLFSVCF